MSYTAIAIGAVLLVLVLDLLLLRTRLVLRKAFWAAYGIVLGFQLIVNGVLAGLPIVRYDRGAILGPRFVYAPVEDLLFGFAMITLTLSCWVALGRRRGLGARG